MLDQSIDDDGQAGEDNCMLQPPQLGRLAQMGCRQNGDDQIAGKRIGALKTMIRSHQLT